MFVFPKTLEEWLDASATDRLQHDPVFAEYCAHHPLRARILLAFCINFDAGFKASERGDIRAADQSSAAMAELVSWLSDDEPQTDEAPSDTVARLVREGFSIEEAFNMNAKLHQRGRGRPVSNRLPALLALEQRMYSDPRPSWMRLAIRFCRCPKTNHDHPCKERLRQQSRILENTLRRLGA